MRIKSKIIMVAAMVFFVIAAVLYMGYPQKNQDLDIEYVGSSIEADSDLPWNLVLVNRWNQVPKGVESKLVRVPGGEKVDRRIFEPLTEMLNDAEDEGLEPIVVSGYRDEKEQARLYDEKVNEYRMQGYSKEDSAQLAQQWVNRPGYSEHQLGIAVDINGATYDIYLWLQENSYKYGFIFRYPGNKTEITGGAEEVWHYRYVGVEAATQIWEQGICLEEYLENQKI